MDWRGDYVGAALLGAMFAAILVAAELWARLGKPKPEWTRKFVHLGGGLVCLFFPFLVKSPWVVLAMAAALAGLFALGARTHLLTCLHGVERRSRGSEYYPLAVFLVFLVARDRLWLYVSSLLVLAVADAFAALVGGKYGVIRYEVEEEHKSLEGSLVFLIITFLALHLPMLLMTDLPRAVCVLAALLVAVLLTGMEAIALRGADNILVPICACVVLSKITTKTLPEIAHQNLSLAGLCLAVGLLAWRSRRFNVGGSIALILFGYAAWSLGSRLWALPLLIGFFVYVLAGLLAAPEQHPVLKVRVVVRAVLPALTMLVAANASSRYAYFYGPYLAAATVAIAFGLRGHLMWYWPERGRSRTASALFGLVAWAAVVLPAWWTLHDGVSCLLAPGAVCVLLCFVDAAVMPEYESEDPGGLWPASRFLLTAGGAGIVLILQVADVLPAWAYNDCLAF